MNFEKEISILLSSSNFVIYISTEEEERLEYILNYISKKLFKQNICSWNFIDGYTNNPNYLKHGKKNPLEALEIIEKYQGTNIKLFFLKDFYLFINDLSVSRKLKNLHNWLKKYDKYIIISGIESKIPKIIQGYVTYITLPLPNKKEIYIEIKRFLQILNINKYFLNNNLSKNYQGFSINQIRKSISKILINNSLQSEILEQILKEKEQLIKQTEILEFFYTNQKLKDIGGLNNFKKWLKVRNSIFTKQAISYGIKTPKGVLLVGIQGTGKSLSAKAISIEWNLPLLKLNISKIFAGILGESENKMQEMIQVCKKIAPCVLWIDEIDKIFTQHQNQNDSGTTSRVANIFLTWLSEKNELVFIVATANNINELPIEMLRKGRFDEIFFVDLPTFKERLDIFKIHLKKIRPLTWYKYNIYYLSKISKQFSGAEIEQSIIEAMYKAFYDKREFSTKDIITSINNIIPLAVTNEIKITKIREWGHSGKVKLA
uniref:Uncharacterized AAA domain-containing protein ycf46 n=1 Tax=Bostrychia simpliciuscula TaxID=324754 RepID=A0A1Z1M875_9FLOR|nr:hypothetical protein [Bostrychia simpliciuscula]ARW61985.1 hypothetical protein [Bostrychia simpliciuscula]